MQTYRPTLHHNSINLQHYEVCYIVKVNLFIVRRIILLYYCSLKKIIQNLCAHSISVVILHYAQVVTHYECDPMSNYSRRQVAKK